MSIGISQTAFNRYVTESATFSVTFPRYNSDEVVVYVEEVATGELTLLVEDTDYTITGILPATGSATITLIDAGQPYLNGSGELDNLTPNTWALIAEYNSAGRQENSFKNLGRFSPVSFERSLDQIVMTLKAQGRALGRALKITRKDITDGKSADIGDLISSSNSKKILQVNSAGTGFELGPTLQSYVGAVAPRTCYIYDDAGGSDGGPSSTTPVPRNLNTLEGDTSFVSLAANVFTLELEGDYLVEWSAPCWQGESHISALYDVTTAPTLVKAGSAAHAAFGSSQTDSCGYAYVSILAPTDYSIYHESQDVYIDGWGRDSSALTTISGGKNIFTQVKVTKVL